MFVKDKAYFLCVYIILTEKNQNKFYILANFGFSSNFPSKITGSKKLFKAQYWHGIHFYYIVYLYLSNKIFYECVLNNLITECSLVQYVGKTCN